MSKSLSLRLNDNYSDKLDIICAELQQKAATKAIQSLIDIYPRYVQLNEDKKNLYKIIADLEQKLREVKEDQADIKKAAQSILSLLDNN